MEENCVIVGLNENEVELELGLSIGGSFKRIEKLKPFKKGHREKSQPLTAAEQECDAAADPQRKRQIQAMRRQEAKRKREEKQQNRGLSCEKIKVEFSGSSDGETKNSGGAPNAGRNVEPNPAFCSVIPVQVPPYPYPHYGFVYPCGTTGTPPCWSGVSGGNDRNAGQQAVNQGFRQFKSSQNSGSGFDSDPNRKSGSNGSTVCTSPLLSDLQSSSNQGGSSSNDIGTKWQLEETATSHQTKPNDHHTQEPVSADSNSKDEPATLEHNKPPGIQVKDGSNHNKTTVDSEKKPPPSSLPHMPCVSATGDGPNGRTVNGFLYRYSQTEVSIVCVCHGSSFSPAEFVQHAGGTAVSQPLRHITVIPSAF